MPLHLTSWRLQSRPKDLGLFFCKAPIHWTSVEQPGEVHSSKRECHSADLDDLRSNFRSTPTFLSVEAPSCLCSYQHLLPVTHLAEAPPCRFCVVIKKENYPEQQQPAKRLCDSGKEIYRLPGHTIYLLPTVMLANLLPCDLNYYIKGTSIKGTLKPGKEAMLHGADTSQNMELGQYRPLLGRHHRHWALGPGAVFTGAQLAGPDFSFLKGFSNIHLF